MGRRPQTRVRKPQNPAWMGFEMQAPDLLGGRADPPVNREAPLSPGQARDNALAEAAYMRQRLDGPLTDYMSTVPVGTPAMPFEPRVPTGPQTGQPELAERRRSRAVPAMDQSLRPGDMPDDPAGGVADVLRTQFGLGPSGRQTATDEQAMMAERRGVSTGPGQTREIDPRVAEVRDARAAWLDRNKTRAYNWMQNTDDAVGDAAALVGRLGLSTAEWAAPRVLPGEAATSALAAIDTGARAMDDLAREGYIPGQAQPLPPRQTAGDAASATPTERPRPASPASNIPLSFGELVRQATEGGETEPSTPRGVQVTRSRANRGAVRRTSMPQVLNMTGYQAQAFAPILGAMIRSGAAERSAALAAQPGAADPEDVAKTRLLAEADAELMSVMEDADATEEARGAAYENYRELVKFVTGLAGNDVVDQIIAQNLQQTLNNR